MAEIIAERPRLNLDPLVNTIRGLANIGKKSEAISMPWNDIWSSRISHSVIFATAGYAYKYDASLVTLSQHEGVEAAKIWHQQAKEDLLDFLNHTPGSIKVFKSIIQNGMIHFESDIIPADRKGNVFERVLDTFSTGRDRILKEGVGYVA